MRKLLLLAFALAPCFAQTPAAYPGAYSIDNDTSTGTTFQKLVKLSAGKAVISGTSPTDPIGICVSNCGTSGPAIIAWSGVVGCVFDNTTTADHWAIPSTSVSGDCSDSGSTTKPTSGPVIGQIKTISGGGAGTVSYVLMTLVRQASGTITSTTSALKGDGGGNAAAVTGTGSNCVHVDGTSAACGGGASKHTVTRLFGVCDSGASPLTQNNWGGDQGTPGGVACGGGSFDASFTTAYSILGSGSQQGWRTAFTLADWDGSSALGVKLFFAGNTTSNGTLVFGVQTSCMASGELINGAITYNAEQTVTVNEGTAQYQVQTPASISSLTTTGCAADEVIRVKVYRKNSGTSVDGIYWFGAAFTY